MASAQRTTRFLKIATATALPVFAVAISNPLHAEASPPTPEIEAVPSDWRTKSQLPLQRHEDQSSWAWGSNVQGLISKTPVDYVKRPQRLDVIPDQPLRHLALHETHAGSSLNSLFSILDSLVAAAVDERGDVLQWGKGFSATDPTSRVTLKGKNIVKLALTEDKVYALSKSGSIYVVASSLEAQTKYPDLSKESWWAFWRHDPGCSVLGLKPREALGRDYFTDIAAGRSHLLARTHRGKVYSHPVDLQANRSGQLGVRNVDVSSGPAELYPEGFEPEPIVAATPSKKTGLARSPSYPKAWVGPDPPPREEEFDETVPTRSSPSKTAAERDIHFCTELYQIPSLKDISIGQIAVGNKHNIVKTQEGRVLAFGSNNCKFDNCIYFLNQPNHLTDGQLGLGSAFSFSVIPTPTEISLAKQQAKCLSIAAGGDLTYVVASKDQGRTIDLLACGHGQFGGIGNGQWSHQGTPTRVKTLSGLIECEVDSLKKCRMHLTGLRQGNEKDNKNAPISIYQLSVGQNHVLATLDNDQSQQYGRDVLAFGHNVWWQLGLGKRSNQAIPQHLPRLARASEKPSQVQEEQFNNIPSRMPQHRLQLQPAVRHKGHWVEETAVAGFDTSAVYWRIIS